MMWDWNLKKICLEWDLNWKIFSSISHWKVVFVQEAIYFFIYMCKSTNLVVYAWRQIFKCGFFCKIDSWNLEFTKRNWMGSLSCWGDDNLKVSLFASGQHGLDYYYCERLAWWSMCQLQTKFWISTIVKNWLDNPSANYKPNSNFKQHLTT